MPSPAVPAPVRGLDPFVALSTAVHAAPGVYALLLGSGVSTSAGIPTGWAIVQDLVRRAAAASDPDQEVGDDLDVERWWSDHGDGEPLGYSSLLHALSPTAAGRDQLLRQYFEASEEDAEQGRKVPTAAHEAIAQLVARGSIRVILTTNFDRLLERALEARGIQPQVIHRSEQVSSMTPLHHVPVTVIKLHGDYADLDKRNTVDELVSYPDDLDQLLRRVLDEYGLIVCGWSAEWDVALIRDLEECKPRRYPIFWASYSTPKEAAQRLITQLGAVVLERISADALFEGIADRLDALDRLSAPPISRDLAVARLKRYLQDPVHRIDLEDVLMDEVRRVEERFADTTRYPLDGVEGLSNDAFWELYDECVTRYIEDTDTLLHLLAALAYYGEVDHGRIITVALQRLLSKQNQAPQRYNARLVHLRQFPVLLGAFTVLSVEALVGKDVFAAPTLCGPSARMPNINESRPLFEVADPWRVFQEGAANALPRWQSTKFLFPESHLIRIALADVLATYESDPDRRSEALSEAECVFGIVELSSGGFSPFVGEGCRPARYIDGPLPVSQRLRDRISAGRSSLPEILSGGDATRLESTLDELDNHLKRAAHDSLFR